MRDDITLPRQPDANSNSPDPDELLFAASFAAGYLQGWLSLPGFPEDHRVNVAALAERLNAALAANRAARDAKLAVFAERVSA